MRTPLEWYIATRYIRANLRQSFIIALAVGIGVSLIIFTPSVNVSFFNDLLNKLVENAPHIRVTREINTLARNEHVLKRVLPPEERLLMSDQSVKRVRNINAYRPLMDALLRQPGIVEAAPYITQQIILVRGGQVRGATLKGIVPSLEKRISDIEDHIQSGNLDTLSGDEVFLGWRLAEEIGVSTGERVQVVTAEGQRSLKVVGLVNFSVYAQDLDSVYVSLHEAQRLLDMPNAVTGIALRIAEIYQAENIAAQLRRSYGLKTKSWMEENEVLLQQIANFKVIMAFINFLIVFAAASSITSVLIMVIANKRKEIGILKAMGAKQGTIIRLFLIQAALLSLLGSGVGVLGGNGFIALYNATPFATAESILGVGRQPVRVSVEYTFLAILYALVSSFLASLIPAWQAGKLDPIQAINQQ